MYICTYIFILTHTHTHTHTQIYFQFHFFCNPSYGLLMTFKAKHVSISYEYTCKITFDGAQYGMLLLLLILLIISSEPFGNFVGNNYHYY